MNTPSSRSTHPLLLVAACAVVLFCTFGIAAIMGWLPSHSTGTTATAPAYSVGDSGTAPAAAAVAAGTPGAYGAPSGGASSGVSSGVSSYGDSGGGTAPLSTTPPAGYAAGPLPAREYAPATAREPAPPQQLAQAAPTVCHSCGVVESVNVQTIRAQGSGMGAGAGAVVGGLLGHTIGGGTGRQLATVAGAVGGAVVGNQVEGNMRATHRYVITVRMDNGKIRTFHQSAQPGWRAGDHVRVVNGALRAD